MPSNFIGDGITFYMDQTAFNVNCTSIRKYITRRCTNGETSGARCLDVIANSISTYLVTQSHKKTTDFECDIDAALEFWSKMFPIIMQQLQDLDQRPRTRWTFCDAYSNIGVHVYERLAVSLYLISGGFICWRFVTLILRVFQRPSQIHIISLLSGIALGDDEPEVRASAVRALAIYVLFPSLKEGMSIDWMNRALCPMWRYFVAENLI